MPDMQNSGDCTCCTPAPIARGTDAGVTTTARRLVTGPDGEAAPDIVCTLDGGVGAMTRRLDEWAAVTGRARGREPADGGVTLVYDHDSDTAAELARLAAAEFDCCSFFAFTLTIGPNGMRLTVTAPPEAADLVAGLFGAVTR